MQVFGTLQLLVIVLGLLGASWACPGRVLGLSWAILRLTWGIFGLSWAILMHLRSVLGLFWAVLGMSWAISGVSWAILGLSCAVLVLFRGRLGPYQPVLALGSIFRFRFGPHFGARRKSKNWSMF